MVIREAIKEYQIDIAAVSVEIYAERSAKEKALQERKREGYRKKKKAFFYCRRCPTSEDIDGLQMHGFGTRVEAAQTANQDLRAGVSSSGLSTPGRAFFPRKKKPPRGSSSMALSGLARIHTYTYTHTHTRTHTHPAGPHAKSERFYR